MLGSHFRLVIKDLYICPRISVAWLPMARTHLDPCIFLKIRLKRSDGHAYARVACLDETTGNYDCNCFCMYILAESRLLFWSGNSNLKQRRHSIMIVAEDGDQLESCIHEKINYFFDIELTHVLVKT